MEPTATSQADPTLSGNGSVAQAGLEGAGSTPAATAGASAASSPEARINALMSRWQQSDAEVARLQGLLATAVASEAALKAQLSEREGATAGEVSAAKGEAETLRARVAELEGQVTTLSAENTTLKFLTENPDLSAYRSVLPSVADTAALEKAAQTIRQARDAETNRLKEHFTTPASGGQTPRKPATAMSAKEIDAYLRTAPPGEFEARLAEVTGRL